MSYQEFNLWMQYFDKRPIGWREDDRTYKLLRAAGVKESSDKIFSSLATMREHERQKEKSNVPSNGSFMHSLLLTAKGGQQLDILKDL